MASIIQQLKGTAAEVAAKVYAQGVLVWNETNKRWHGGDGVTLGGIPMARYDDRNLGALGYLQEVRTAAASNVVAADNGKALVANRATALAFNLDPAATLAGDFLVMVRNVNSGLLSIVPNGTELIDGVNAAITVPNGASLILKCDGVAFRTYLSNTDVASALANRVRYDSAEARTLSEQGQARANIGAGVLAGFRDKLINGNGAISQRTYTTVADDAYWCDRHYVLAQTAAITPTVLADVANGLPSMMRLTQSQAAAQRMGNAQIVEASESKPLRGKTVTLGGKLRCSASQPIRYAVLEWTGTADAVTSDVVNNWTSGVYTPGNFFLAANLTVAAVGSITPSANTITDFALTAAISSACNNLIVLYWTEGAAAQNVALDVAWGLVEGNATAETYPYGRRHYLEELGACQRYREQGYYSIGGYAAGAGGQATSLVCFQVQKRVTPTITVDLSIQASNAGSPVTDAGGRNAFRVVATAGISGQMFGQGGFIADAEL